MRVYDGDTMTVAMALNSEGFRAYQIRLFGCDAPEMKGTTKDAAIRARDEVLRYIAAEGAIGLKRGIQENTWFRSNPIILEVQLMSESLNKTDKYGRELAQIRVRGKTKTLTDHLIATGLAYEYQGGKKDQAQYEDD